MIYLIHENNKALKVLDNEFQEIEMALKQSITMALIDLAEKFPDDFIIWCEHSYLEDLNREALTSIFHHERILASFNPGNHNYITEAIGYVDRSWFININKKVPYPTWITSSLVGGIHASIILRINPKLVTNNGFDYFLNDLGKRAIRGDLFCYSSPDLLKSNSRCKTIIKPCSTATLFKFVKEHYKLRWLFFLSLSYLIYEKKTTFFSLLKGLFYKKRLDSFNLEFLQVKSSKIVTYNQTIDVIIPTIGRKKFLYDVLKDLSSQTILPKNVIIVEQSAQENALSELDYITTKNWPFAIKHTFTHQVGVCNARNIALGEITSDWVFFADDDIRLETDFFEKTFEKIDTYKIDVISYLCLQPHQKQTFFKMEQTTVFGSGSSFCSKEAIKGLKFNTSYEFGFGEDSDFGMQLRNKGFDVIFIPDIKILHLKAPVGGFRTKVKQLWENDKIQPKPSPTMQLLYKTYFTNKQLLGYKLFLGLKSYNYRAFKNPYSYFKTYSKQWRQSQYWANKL
ncbi:glycosyltransferase family 2 protein [Mariniflexile sp.]|uniref:glycosyltransferase family 2 protein n=1 Tax=Mariniflexile sp. TaxID=1979402 RepID=UPI003565F003